LPISWLRLNVDTPHDDACTNYEGRIKVIDPAHPLYQKSFEVISKGKHRIFIDCNGTQVAVGINSTNLGYINKERTGKLCFSSVDDLVLFAKSIGVI
uniref:hypothetical protein n=1 Tax=Cysteiniphilum sp. SYW-8 TaxID=2610890 RepID=UPI001CD0F442